MPKSLIHRKLGEGVAEQEVFAGIDEAKNGCPKSVLFLLGSEGRA
jgi:hypothetical protein